MKVVYAYDALCGWCYGFSIHIKKFYENHSKELPFEVLSGGMVTGDRIGPIANMGTYIKEAHQRVEKLSGVKFGEKFIQGTLERTDLNFNSLPPAHAMSVFKKYNSKEAVLYASALQQGIYFEGFDPESYEWMANAANDLGLNKDVFLKEVQSPAAIEASESDFYMCQQLGISGFPSVFIEHENTYYMIAKGFTSADDLELRFKSVKEEIDKKVN